MNVTMVDAIANTILYDGYLRSPYRANALENRHCFNFGSVAPRALADAGRAERSFVQTEGLVRAGADARVSMRARFLHLFESSHQHAVSCQGAVEREIRVECALAFMTELPLSRPFDFGAESPGQAHLRGRVDASAHRVARGVLRIRLVISNLTDVVDAAGLDQAGVARSSLASTHAILQATGGEFVSLLDPPGDLLEAAAGCENVGLWPVMVGEEHERDAMLASPIILYDYPRIPTERAAGVFEGTEIDEMLALRVRTMTDEEKARVRIRAM